MSDAYHYTKEGTGWYTFVNVELAETTAHPVANDSLNPYLPGNDVNAPIIALGEGWAYHMGHFLANQRYTTTASPQSEQDGTTWACTAHPCSFWVNSTAPHADVLENFNPKYIPDPFNWIPKGLMWDLMDNTPTEAFPVIDNVNGFTIAQLFNALQSDVTSVSQYRDRFIQQNQGNQTTNVTNLFAQYNY